MEEMRMVVRAEVVVVVVLVDVMLAVVEEWKLHLPEEVQEGQHLQPSADKATDWAAEELVNFRRCAKVTFR